MNNHLKISTPVLLTILSVVELLISKSLDYTIAIWFFYDVYKIWDKCAS